MRNNKGFSLVELIVVIAIMAILAAVAVAGFSMYIPKAQQSNDRQLISDIEYALTLAGYNGEFAEGETGVIILTTTGIETENAKADAALKAMYGDDYADSIKLAYDEWGNTVVTFQGSSLGNDPAKIEQLMGTVTDVTGKLSQFMEDESFNAGVFGANFNGYLSGLGIDPTKDSTSAGNAAVLYVAQNTAGKADAVKNAVAEAIAEVNAMEEMEDSDFYGSDDWANAVVSQMQSKLTGSLGNAGGMAAMYAYAESFGQYHTTQTGSSEALDEFHTDADFEGVTDTTSAWGDIKDAFKDLLKSGKDSVSDYLTSDANEKSQSEKDLEGYVSAMGMVHQSANTLKGSLSDTGAFTQTATSLIDMYLSVEQGQVGIMYRYSEGIMTFTNTIPENAN